jgi:hypothetical protein
MNTFASDVRQCDVREYPPLEAHTPVYTGSHTTRAHGIEDGLLHGMIEL